VGGGGAGAAAVGAVGVRRETGTGWCTVLWDRYSRHALLIATCS
jgi:hypothetical protein